MPNHPAPRWSVVAVFVTSVGLTLYSLNVSLTASRQQVAAERKAREAVEQARLLAEQRQCEIIRIQDDIYQESPPQSDTGKRLARAINDYRVYRCP